MDYDFRNEKLDALSPDALNFLEIVSKTSNFECQNLLQESPCDRTQGVKAKLIPVVEVEEAKELKQNCPKLSDMKDQKDSGLLQMWWVLIQDQLGTMTREIDGLRAVNSQLQARFTEALMQRSGGQVQDSMELLSQMAQEQNGLKQAVQSDRDDSNSAYNRLWDALRVETQKRAQLQDGYERLREEMAEVARKFSVTVENEQQNRASCFSMLQSQVSAMSKEFASEREDWAQRRSDLHANIMKYFGEQQDHNHKALSEHVAAEKKMREDLLAQVRSDREELVKIVGDEERARISGVSLLDGRLHELQQIQDAGLAELRRQVAEDHRLQTASSESLNSQVDLVRGALTQMYSEREAHQEAVQTEICEEHRQLVGVRDHVASMSTSHEATTAEVKVLGEACAAVHSQTLELQSTLANLQSAFSFCHVDVKELQEAHQNQKAEQTSLQEQLSAERQSREEIIAYVEQEIQRDVAKANADQEIGIAELRDLIDMKSESCQANCSAMSGEAQQEIAASFVALREILAEERAARETSQNVLDQRLNEKLQQMEVTKTCDADVKRLVSEVCCKERDQAKALLAHAKQMLESDAALRQKLESVLQCEMVSKEEFMEEIGRLWQSLKPDSADSESTRFLSAAHLEKLGSVSITPGLDPPLSARSSHLHFEQRGASPLPPNRVKTAPVGWQPPAGAQWGWRPSSLAQGTGGLTPQTPRSTPTFQGSHPSPAANLQVPCRATGQSPLPFS